MTDIATQEAGCIARRPFLRAVGGAATAAVVGGAGVRRSSQNAEAIDWETMGQAAATTVVGGPIALAWTMRDYNPFVADSPPEGLTASALHQRSYELSRLQESENNSTFVDNSNMVPGAANASYTEAKIAAIEALNEEESQEAVENAGLEIIDRDESTIKRNVLRSWNESVELLIEIANQIQDHPDLLLEDQMVWARGDSDMAYTIDGLEIQESADELYPDYPSQHTEEFTLPDGTTQNHYLLAISGSSNALMSVFQQGASPSYYDAPDENTFGPVINEDVNASSPDDWSGDFNGWSQPLDHLDWWQLWTEIEDEFADIRDSFILWADFAYSEVQSGGIDVTDLITPRERAEMMADEEDLAPAIADLIALNANVDPEREATITLVERDVTLRGTFARSANPDGEPLESGETYDPTTDLTGDVYFSYNVGEGEGVWNDVETGVDGGTVTFTSEPIDVLYRINTTAEETAEVVKDDFVEDEEEAVWTVDVSEQLENQITEVESVEFYDESGETRYETVLLQESFEIEKFEDSDGEEVDSATFEQSSEPQTDDNYITQEEWDELQSRNEKLIEKYEESQTSGGGFWPDVGFDGGGGPIAGAVVAFLAFLGIAKAVS